MTRQQGNHWAVSALAVLGVALAVLTLWLALAAAASGGLGFVVGLTVPALFIGVFVIVANTWGTR